MVETPELTKEIIENEAKRLHESLRHLNYSLEDCLPFAPLTYQINKIKKEKNAVILAHNYQKPEILFGIADFRGDSLGLSRKAQETNADIILFCGVKFMAETAKILNPQKKVLLPALDAGCSLADAITAEDVRKLKKKYPDAAVVTYVNTSAEVKAESDICCTSANALQVVEALPEKKIIFLPDKLMAENIRNLTDKEIINYDATCVVHEVFTVEQIEQQRKAIPGIKVIAHMECKPEVVKASDAFGSTSTMSKYVKEHDDTDYMIITECGMADLLKVENPDKNFVVPCSICPYMKKINLENTLKTLQEEKPEVNVPEDIRVRAAKAVNRMLELV